MCVAIKLHIQALIKFFLVFLACCVQKYFQLLTKQCFVSLEIKICNFQIQFFFPSPPPSPHHSSFFVLGAFGAFGYVKKEGKEPVTAK